MRCGKGVIAVSRKRPGSHRPPWDRGRESVVVVVVEAVVSVLIAVVSVLVLSVVVEEGGNMVLLW